MSWLHSREPGNFQMNSVCEDDLSSDTKAVVLGGFLLKFDSIRKFVTKGAWNHFESMFIGQYQSFCPSQK